MTALTKNIEDVRQMLPQLQALQPKVDSAAAAISKTLLAGGRLLACGNGGSAADASHLTTEFVCRFNQDRKPYAAISLATHGGDITAIGNDYAFEDLFARQVEAFGRPGDVLAAFTTSGASENVRRALVTAKQCGLTTISFLGRNGGKCAGLAEIEMIVPGMITARIQEGHKLLLHTICEMVDESLQAAEEKQRKS